MAATMKAWQRITLSDMLKSSLVLNESAPAPDRSSLSKDQILVEVITAAINPVDYKVPEGDWLGRTFGMAKDANPGLDFCGRVVAVHPSNTAFTEGQLVFGALKMASRFGTLGQFTIVSGSECAALPGTVEPDHAAAVGTACGTALKSLLPDFVKPGSKIFINGGSGGVGTFGIQIAKALGAEVTTSCSTANVELCRQLGADEVLDYKKTDIVSDLMQKGQVFDLIIDNVGSPAALYEQNDCFLKSNGTFVQVAAQPSIPAMGVVLSKKLRSLLPGVRSRGFHFVMVNTNHDDYVQIGRWLAEGKIRPVIDEAFLFEDVLKAYEKLRTGHAKGKIIVHVAKK